MRHCPTRRLFSLLVPLATAFAADTPKPLTVFVPAGQSNMEGQAVIDLDGTTQRRQGDVELSAARYTE